jgi:hypothetical protein
VAGCHDRGLVTRALVDVDLAGNFYAVRRAGRITRLRPDWVTIVTGSRTGSEIDTELLGYMYQPDGPYSSEDPVFCCRSRSRISWISPIRSPGTAACHG